MGLIKTLLILLLIYYAFKFFIRLFGPLLMKKAMSKMQQKAEQQFGGAKPPTDVKVGETIIDKKPSNNKTNDNELGDYVEFEEIE